MSRCPSEYPIECSDVQSHHPQQETFCAKTKEQCKQPHQVNALSYDSYRKKKKKQQTPSSPHCPVNFPIDCATVQDSKQSQQMYCAQTIDQCRNTHQVNTLVHNVPYRKKKKRQSHVEESEQEDFDEQLDEEQEDDFDEELNDDGFNEDRDDGLDEEQGDGLDTEH